MKLKKQRGKKEKKSCQWGDVHCWYEFWHYIIHWNSFFFMFFNLKNKRGQYFIIL